jgi:hypothetical protein
MNIDDHREATDYFQGDDGLLNAQVYNSASKAEDEGQVPVSNSPHTGMTSIDPVSSDSKDRLYNKGNDPGVKYTQWKIERIVEEGRS